MSEELDRFTFRLGDGPRDKRVRQWIQERLDDDVNVSEKIKELIDAHIRGVVIMQQYDATQQPLSEIARSMLDFGD